MMGEPSRLDRLQIRLNLMRRTVRELEEQIERERNPATRHAKPKLTVIKGGLSAWVGPFAAVGTLAKEHLAATTAAAATVAAAAAGGAAIIAETPLQADADQRVTSSLQAPRDIAAPPGGDLGGSVDAVTPRPDTNPPGEPAGASTPTPGPVSAPVAQQMMPLLGPSVAGEPLPDLATIEPLPEPTVEPEPVPTPEPSPTGTEPALESPKNAGLAHVEAVDACLAAEGPPKMQDCLAALVS